MINFDGFVNKNKRTKSKLTTNPYSSEWGITNSLLNLSNKICLYANDPFEAKRQFLIKKRKSAGLKHFKDSKAFIEYSNYMDNTFKNIEEYNPNKKCKILFVLDDIIADTLSNKKLNTIVTELFIRGRKLNISLDFNAQSSFCTARKC